MGDIVNKESDIYKQKKDFVDTLISGDILFIISLFSLGSGFWERLKDLFKWHPGKKTEQSSDCLKN